MALPNKVMTVEEFEAYATLPENADRRLEWIGGQIHEVVSNNLSSNLGMTLGGLVTAHVFAHDLGLVTGADGGYQIGENYCIPDFAFVAKAKQSRPTHEAYNPIPPDLVIEVVSPSNTPKEISDKTAGYLSVGAMVWTLDPIAQTIKVDAPGKATRLLGLDDTLDGGDVLPGFSVAIRRLFGK